MSYIDGSHWIGIGWEVDHAGPLNTWYAFRRVFRLDEAPQSAAAEITADSRFIFFVNGSVVGRGPARCRPDHQAYESFDITTKLVRGENCFAVLVYRFGTSTGQYVNRGRTGLLLWAEAAAGSGAKTVVRSDLAWKVRQAEWLVPTANRISCQLGFQEIHDLSKNSESWKHAAYDESKGWQPVWFIGPARIHPWTEIVPSRLQQLAEYEVPAQVCFAATLPGYQPSTVAENVLSAWPAGGMRAAAIPKPDPDGWTALSVPEGERVLLTVDCGRVIAGYPKIEIKGGATSGRLDVFYHTSLAPDGSPIPDSGFGSPWEGNADRALLGEGTTTFRPQFCRGFRFYSCAIGGVRGIEVRPGVVRTHYPVTPVGSFACSDPVLERAWEITTETLKSTMLDAHVDNPWREQGQWCFDGKMAGLAALAAFGSGDLFRRLLVQVAESVLPEGFLNSLVPTEYNFMCLVDYSFEWAVGVQQYYLATGDVSLLKEVAPALESVVRSAARFTTEEGLFVPPEGYQYFVDWADLDRRPYAFTLNAMLVQAYESAAYVFSKIGKKRSARFCSQRGRTLRRIIERSFWSSSANCYCEQLEPSPAVREVLSTRIQPPAWPQTELLPRKARGEGSMHGNATALLLGLGGNAQRIGALRYVLRGFDESQDEVNFFSPIWVERVFSALFAAGEGREAIRLLSPLLDGEMRRGCTTWAESFARGTDQVRAIAGWPAAQETLSGFLPLLQSCVAGVKPVQPGYHRFTMRPVLGALTHAAAAVPTPHGPITVELSRDGSRVLGRIETPPGIEGMALGTIHGNQRVTPGAMQFEWSE